MNDRQTFDVSVIIAVYNGGGTLRRAIDSVLAQTVLPGEVIVVDDGSTDDTAAVAASYGEPVRLIRQPNRGVSAARNTGVEQARGEWIAFLDADDYYYPRRLELTAELIGKHSEVDFVTADFDYINEEGSPMRRSMSSTALGRRLLERAGEGFVLMGREHFGDFIEDHFGDTHTLTMRRETFMELGGYCGEFAVCEDVHLLVRLCSVSRLAGVICTPVAAYVIHPGSATRSDPIRAQLQTVKAWKSLEPIIPSMMKEGYGKGLARARYNLAVALLREGKRLDSVKAILPLLREAPSWNSLKKVGSVLRG